MPTPPSNSPSTAWQLFSLPPRLKRLLVEDFPLPEGGLNKTQVRTLFVLRHLDHPHMSEVSRRLDLEKGSFTAVVDALMDRGLVRRVPHPADRRKVTLELTPAGERQLASLQEAMSRHVERRLEALPRRERAELDRALATLQRVVEQMEHRP